jgi:hypothetical protein
MVALVIDPPHDTIEEPEDLAIGEFAAVGAIPPSDGLVCAASIRHVCSSFVFVSRPQEEPEEEEPEATRHPEPAEPEATRHPEPAEPEATRHPEPEATRHTEL